MSRVVITGANRGLGLELARVHIQRGNDVIAGCRTPDAASDLAALNPAAIISLDVADEDSVTTFAGRLGDEPISLLINNAGASIASLGVERSQAGVLNVSMQATLELINVNGLSAAMVSRALVPHMEAGSKIINISSQIGSMVVGANFDDLPYSTSKAVMNMVTVQLATQLKDQNITVACFHPGWVRTDMGGQSADLSPEESAAGIVSKTDALTPADSGQFFRWDGTVHPW